MSVAVSDFDDTCLVITTALEQHQTVLSMSMAKFIFRASRVGLTYTGAKPATLDQVKTIALTWSGKRSRLEKYLIGKEHRADGGYDIRCFLEFAGRFETKNARLFDIKTELGFLCATATADPESTQWEDLCTEDNDYITNYYADATVANKEPIAAAEEAHCLDCTPDRFRKDPPTVDEPDASEPTAKRAKSSDVVTKDPIMFPSGVNWNMPHEVAMASHKFLGDWVSSSSEYISGMSAEISESRDKMQALQKTIEELKAEREAAYATIADMKLEQQEVTADHKEANSKLQVELNSRTLFADNNAADLLRAQILATENQPEVDSLKLELIIEREKLAKKNAVLRAGLQD